MTVDDVHAEPAHPAAAEVRARFARAPSRLYVLRTGVSLVWVLAVSAAATSLGDVSSPSVLVTMLLVLYPLTDAAATLIDIRTTPPQSQTLIQRANLVISSITAAAVLAVTGHGFDAVLVAFGIWAILSGVIQLLVAVRRNTLISAQWFMVISGAGSIFAGTAFLQWSGSTHDGLGTLVQYSTGGAIWYAVAAAWILASSARASQTT